MGFYFVNPNLVLVVGLRQHGPFANYQEFLIRLLFLVSSAFKDKTIHCFLPNLVMFHPWKDHQVLLFLI
jgi:hypothetical protein